MDKTIQRLNKLGIGPFKERILPPDAVEKFRESLCSQSASQDPDYPNREYGTGVDPTLAGESPHKEFLDQKGGDSTPGIYGGQPG
jgi:hypothetical protein